MSYREDRFKVPHPIARKLPRQKPTRVELNVYRDEDVGDDDFDRDICDCYPRASARTIPSMLYDGIRCPHENELHIQPAQEDIFTYPWTAKSIGHQVGYKSLDDNLSLIIEEDVGEVDSSLETRSGGPLAQINTAPPFARPRHPHLKNRRFNTAQPNVPLRSHPPPRKAASVPSLTPIPASPPPPSRLPTTPGRQFVGEYVDPKDGKVYNYRVKYGKQDITGIKHPQNGYRRDTPSEEQSPTQRRTPVKAATPAL